ncbi:MAG: YadA-like family protein [Negativicoccus succinicivorans]|uniref:ESPR-type extended signal peptide-containing protein n=1 Tax=Negativicoccus succinicivorans TaxID=620903 RepID=UPI0026EB0773|nr:ESPR-type extended signal peptide-containing protein [Negativicoccus succinicivorans]MBS5887734.1 YadA-like family protein [Negativicoccus succinicivorans]
MNKIYKLVWSKVKGAWVVTSEIAKGHGKAAASRQRKSIAAVMAVLALGFIPGVAYAAIDGVTTFVEPGNQNVQIGNGISLRNNNGKNGAVAIGDHVQIDDYVMQEGSVAIGKNAFVENLWGNQEKLFKFNQEDVTKLASSIAIGQNAYARSGSTMIGDHKYIGKLGDTDVDGSDVQKVKSKNININATTIGANSYNQGAFSSVLGTYSIISGKYNGSRFSPYGIQNMGASIVGSLNSIESDGSSDKLSGIANSVVGIANRTNNANGALIFGAGNEIENSIGTLSGITGGGASAKDLADKLRNTVKSSNGGGAVLAIGGGNKANYAKASQLMGVNNTLTGAENAASDYNLLNGFKNVGTNISHVSVIGSENQVTDTKNALVFGDKRKLTKANGSVVLGVSDTVKEIKVEDVTVIGHNALAEGANAVAIGHAASADSLSTVAIGDEARVSSNANLSGGVAIGKKSNVINGNGKQEKYLGFGTLNDPQRSATGVAIGAYSFARTGSIQIGAHTYLGTMGGTDITDGTNGEANHINQTTVGTNTFNKGIFGTMIGAYSISTGSFTAKGGMNSLRYGSQNFGSTVVGSLNTIQSKGHTGSAGISNSIVGLANVTENTNGTLIFGAGNKVTNSIKSISGVPNGVTSGAATPDELIEKLRQGTIDSESGGSTMVVGGGNTADYTRASQIMGVNNTLTGTKDKVSTYNLVDGFKNKAENVTHVTMIGSDNEVKNTTGAVLLGDKRKLTAADGSIVLGSADENAETNVKNATVIGHNANTTVESGVALGSDSVADRGKADAETVYLHEDKGVKATVKGELAAVSVGNEDATRQITGVAAGTKDTDAVNVAQLKAAAKNITDSFDDTTLKADTNALSLNGSTLKLSVKDTKDNEVTGSVDLKDLKGAVNTDTIYTLEGKENDNNTTTIFLTDSNDKKQQVTVATKDTRNTIVDSDTVTVEAKAQEDGSNEYKLNVKTDGKVEKDNKGIVTGGTVYNETRIEKDGNYIKAENTASQNLTVLDKQVDANTTNITKLENNIYDMGGRIGELGNRVDRVGAGAAALAALHPLDFDRDDKWDFAAGYGNYSGANAVAIGAYYRPNEDTMFSVGGSFGGGENMVNAGVSVKLGQGNNVSTSRVVMANEIQELKTANAQMQDENREIKNENKEMRNEIEILKQQMQKLMAGK